MLPVIQHGTQHFSTGPTNRYGGECIVRKFEGQATDVNIPSAGNILNSRPSIEMRTVQSKPSEADDQGNDESMRIQNTVATLNPNMKPAEMDS